MRALLAEMRTNRFIAGIAVLAALGGFLFGYDTGVISGALPYMSKSLNIGSFGQSWVVGSLLLGAIAGAILSGWLADAISRRWTKFLGGCVYTAAALGSAFAPSIIFLCVARFVLGLAVGTASFVAPMYISEHSPKRVRGAMTTFNQFMITLGILIAYIADFALKGFSHNWRWMLAFGAIPGIALAVSMALVPHSPRWLLEQDRRDEAADVLKHSRDPDEIDPELDDIQEAVEAQESVGWRNLISPRVRPLLVVGLALAIFQQIIGINTIIYFGATVLHYMGYSVNVSVGRAVYLGIINWAAAAIALLMLDFVGRRKMLLVGTVGCGLSLVAVGWFFHEGTAWQHAHAGIAGLAPIMGYLFFFEIGLGPIFWLMISEIYPLRIRSKAMAAATVGNWAFNFLISYFFLDMT
ncbi:MAG TPA: sugar porter family MFS transporter, partial [Mycobacterium sp.]|nr:sugar porter family MFS transporter [Mycobacterium sp.]